MSRSLASALLLLLCGCASASSGSSVRGTMATADIGIQTGNTGNTAIQSVSITSNSGVGVVAVAASPERVWAVLPAVYADLGIPLSGTDPAQKLLIAQNQQVSKIGGKRLSTFFTCGGVYGDNADSGNSFVSARTQVVAGPNGEAIAKTEVRAAAAGTGSTVGECGSKGTLEKLIGETIQAKSLAAQ